MDTGNIELATMLIRIGAAVVMILFGIEQLLKPRKWIDYIPHWLRNLSPLSAESDMRAHSIGNIIIGLWLLIGFAPIVGIWVCIIWWITILPFAFWHNWRIGLRDMVITLSLIALLLLTKMT